MIDTISQYVIMVLGPLAVWMVGWNNKYRKYGYLVGVISQPFWFITLYYNNQWPIFICAILYTYSWANGAWNFIFKAHRRIIMNQYDLNDKAHRLVNLPSHVKRPKHKGYVYDYVDALELYTDNLEALLAAKSEWQPIETAPKDGTYYLATSYLAKNDKKYAVLNEPHGYAKGYWEKTGNQWVGYAEMRLEATHWMHLPVRGIRRKAE